MLIGRTEQLYLQLTARFGLSEGVFGTGYGAAGSLVIVLLSVYYSLQTTLLGAEFTKVYARRLGWGCDIGWRAMRELNCSPHAWFFLVCLQGVNDGEEGSCGRCCEWNCVVCLGGGLTHGAPAGRGRHQGDAERAAPIECEEMALRSSSAVR